jgi:hypothetical protein
VRRSRVPLVIEDIHTIASQRRRFTSDRARRIGSEHPNSGELGGQTDKFLPCVKHGEPWRVRSEATAAFNADL